MASEQRRQYNLYHKLWMRKFRAKMTPEEFKAYRSKQAELGKSYGDTDKAYRQKLKLDVINGYGGVCVCCNESYPAFLTIDHVVPLRSNKRKWRSLFLKLRRENFPPGYQVLCFNCNQAKGTEAECPHKRLDAERFTLFRLLSGGRTA